jgi:hypothetical protein
MAMAGSSPPPSWTGISSNLAPFSILFRCYLEIWAFLSTDTDPFIFSAPE